MVWTIVQDTESEIKLQRHRETEYTCPMGLILLLLLVISPAFLIGNQWIPKLCTLPKKNLPPSLRPWGREIFFTTFTSDSQSTVETQTLV
jgi:hypothetical protein